MFCRNNFVRPAVPLRSCRRHCATASKFTCSCVNCQAFCLRDTSDCRNPANREIFMTATVIAPLTVRLTADACRHFKTLPQCQLNSLFIKGSALCLRFRVGFITHILTQVVNCISDRGAIPCNADQKCNSQRGCDSQIRDSNSQSYVKRGIGC